MLNLFPLVLAAITTMSTTNPQTLRALAGATETPSSLGQSVVIVIDAQKEYQNGAIPLVGFSEAVAEIGRLLARARACDVPIIHVIHKAKPEAKVFDPERLYVEIVDELKPIPGEIIVEKRFPDSFTQTVLESELQKLGRKDLVIVGFMTHMCVSSTTRDAAERGYRCNVIAAACATRDLPSIDGGVVEAQVVHAVSLAALRDRFAVVLKNQSFLPD